MKGPAIAFVLLLVGCPPAQKHDATDAAAGACGKVGQTCEVAPGKLGTCVAQDDCPVPGACFVCQSQH